MEHASNKTLSTGEAARLLKVGTTSIKRWADEGVLPYTRTAGGHRRFDRADVLALQQSGAERRSEGPVDAEVDPLTVFLHGNAHHVEAELLNRRAALGSWARVSDGLGDVLTEIGERWARGEIEIMDEHVAVERLIRALQRIRASLPIAPDAPVILLACAQEDDHTVGLHLAELASAEVGWKSVWAGRRTPVEEIVRTVHSIPVDVVGLSASLVSTDEVGLQRLVRRIGEACEAKGASIVLGGSGAWPRGSDIARRFHSFIELQSHLRAIRLR